MIPFSLVRDERSVCSNLVHPILHQPSGNGFFPLAASDPMVEIRLVGSAAHHFRALLLALSIGEEWKQIGGEEPHADWEAHPTST